MKKILSIFIIATEIFVGASCSKSSDLATEMLVGTWTLSEGGSDRNDNNKVDEGETYTFYSPDTFGILTLNSDKTYKFVYSSGGPLGSNINETGTWAYMNNQIILTTTSGSNTMQVHSVTNDKLVFRIVNLWAIYVK